VEIAAVKVLQSDGERWINLRGISDSIDEASFLIDKGYDAKEVLRIVKEQLVYKAGTIKI
jgi:hypothetical protein